MRVVALALIVAAGCGDNARATDPMFAGFSGSRIKLQWYLYQDGTRQLETAAFYDTGFHARCAPREWIDGVTRCVPLAEDTVFVDAECTTEVGQMKLNRKPTHYIGHDRVDGVRKPARLYRAGTQIDTPTQFFERRDGACVAIAQDLDVAEYIALNGPYEIDRAIEVWPEEQMMDDRLGLSILTSAEGLAAPIAYRDHELALDCRPEVLADGTAACVPTASTTAEYFADPFCSDEPVVVAAEPPRVAAVADDNGCPRYHGVDAEVTTLLYRKTATCERASLAAGQHAYRVGGPLPLAEVTRTVEAAPKHRLQRVRIAAGQLETLDNRLYDTATRTDCRSYGNGELAICVPANAVDATRLYANPTCAREVIVAEVSRVACDPPAFAVADTPSIHAIGAAYDGALYEVDIFGNCRPHVVATGKIAHAVGPAIPLDAFVGGVVYSER